MRPETPRGDRWAPELSVGIGWKGRWQRRYRGGAGTEVVAHVGRAQRYGRSPDSFRTYWRAVVSPQPAWDDSAVWNDRWAWGDEIDARDEVARVLQVELGMVPMGPWTYADRDQPLTAREAERADRELYDYHAHGRLPNPAPHPGALPFGEALGTMGTVAAFRVGEWLWDSIWKKPAVPNPAEPNVRPRYPFKRCLAEQTEAYEDKPELLREGQTPEETARRVCGAIYWQQRGRRNPDARSRELLEWVTGVVPDAAQRAARVGMDLGTWAIHADLHLDGIDAWRSGAKATPARPPGSRWYENDMRAELRRHYEGLRQLWWPYGPGAQEAAWLGLAAWPNPAGYAGTGYVCLDKKGRRVPCTTRGARPTEELMYRPRLPGGERPRVYLPAGHELGRLGEEFAEVRREARGEGKPRWRRPERGRPADPASPLRGLLGAATHVYVATASGRPEKLPAHYRMVSEDLLVPSHRWDNFAPHPDYPGGVQERRYHTDKQEQLKVLRQAQGLRPDLLITDNADAVNGPPVVLPTGVTLGGNSRVMTLQRVFNAKELREQRRDYIAELRRRAGRFGFLPDDVSWFTNPVLVRVIDPPDQSPAALRDLVRRFNEVFTQGMDPVAMQVALAGRIDQRVLDAMAASKQPDETLNEYLRDGRSKELVIALERSGFLDPRNRAVYVGGNGLLNDDGRTVVSRAMLGRVVPDPTLLDVLSDEVRNVLADSVPAVLQAASYGAGWDLTAELRDALRLYVQLLGKKGADGKLPTVDDFLANLDWVEALEGREPTEGTRYLLWIIRHRMGPRIVPAGFRKFAAIAASESEVTGGMLGFQEPRSPLEALRLAFGPAPVPAERQAA